MLCAKAHAKINLFLDAIEKGENYTKIRTIFTEISLHDELRFESNRSGEIELNCNAKQISCESNLVFRIASYLKKTYKIKQGIKITLKKNIPIASGLGGGSSNAACTLLALEDLWELNLSEHKRNSIASSFGSDINFFLEGGAGIGRDRGQKISCIDLGKIENILLVNPNIQISSKLAYDSVQNYGKSDTWQKFIDFGDIRDCYNALEQGVTQKYPVIGSLISSLEQKGAIKVILSGSGATVIGFFDSKEKSIKAKNHFEKNFFWTYLTKTVRRKK